MKEVKEHIIYELLENKYNRLEIDYVIISSKEYKGLESHKEAVIKSLEILSERYDCTYEINTKKMSSKLSSIDELLELPEDNYYDKRIDKNHNYTKPEPITYWYAFLEPPHGVPYLTKNFIDFNNILFPNKEYSEVYRWNDNFSDYFSEGLEWWGTGLWSIYDKTSEIFIIIAVSASD